MVCCGSGGVGKTTTSAALALRAAERGRKVVVLTIDPARRLAQSMGIEKLDNVPRARARVGAGRRRPLDAMMLDMKRTFDEVVESQASPEKAAQILANPFYQALSSSFAGTQEYMAMEKLGQLHADAQATGRWDLIVVDTPAVPVRAGLPGRARAAVGLPGRPVHPAAADPGPRPGPADDGRARHRHRRDGQDPRRQMLRDVQTFVGRVRHPVRRLPAAGPADLPAAPGRRTAFLVVAAPEPDALREAAFFVERLARSGCRSRAWWSTGPAPTPGGRLIRGAGGRGGGAARRGAARRAHRGAAPAARRAARASSTRETRLRRRFASAHPDVPTAVVPALSTDVHDLDGLRLVGACSPASLTGARRRTDRAGDATGQAVDELARVGGDADGGHVVLHARSRAADATR